jgi:Protein of unknown function (DUF998)
MTDTITTPDTRTCDPADRVTRSLLGYGVLAGPVYVGVSLAQALTREGFDLTRHPWSVLANGGPGWIQIANLALTGAMVIAAAVGLRRALRGGRAGKWGPRLIGGYGAGMLAASVFKADPVDGFPVGTPSGQVTMSWHGMLHFATGGVGFVCFIAACFVLAGRFARAGERGWAWYSRATGLVFLAGFAAAAVPTAGNLAFTAGVIATFVWLGALSVRMYRRIGASGQPSTK